jgi:hypothetical protein
MRLSDKNARRLTWLVWRDRAMRWLPVAAAGAGLLVAVAFLTETRIGRSDRTVDVQVHKATVVDIKRTAQGGAMVHVRLDDGRIVDAVSLFRVAPTAGSHVVVNEERHASGHLTFDVVRFDE